MKKVFVTGVTGQLCSYLVELLLEQKYEVHAMVRRGSTLTTERINHLLVPEEKIFTYFGDMADANSIVNLLKKIEPDYIFNVASMSHVRVSFDIPEYTMNITGTGPLRILEAMKSLGMKDTRFLQLSSSEMFGSSHPPQNETTTFRPQSPYGIAKLAAYWATRCYRTGYNMFACNAICFNMESPRRGETFVTQKIIRGAVRAKLGLQDKLYLGNLSALRDWGYAKEYAEGLIKIITHNVPDDFVLSTEEYHSIQEFAERVFKKLNLDWHDHVKFSDQYMRPNEVSELRGNSKKAHDILNWHPKTSFDQLIDMMIDSAMKEEIRKTV